MQINKILSQFKAITPTHINDNCSSIIDLKTTYIKGPLKDLKTNWLFKSIKKNKTLINFEVEFEFKRFFHQKIAETFFL